MCSYSLILPGVKNQQLSVDKVGLKSDQVLKRSYTSIDMNSFTLRLCYRSFYFVVEVSVSSVEGKVVVARSKHNISRHCQVRLFSLSTDRNLEICQIFNREKQRNRGEYSRAVFIFCIHFYILNKELLRQTLIFMFHSI